MKAGREWDALVAEKVMGWTDRVHKTETCYPEFDVTATPPNWGAYGARYHRVPDYSTDISAAWQVVEIMRERKAAFVLGVNGCSAQVSAWFHDGIWALGKNQNSVPKYGDSHLLGVATADTAPFAICLAALKAVSR